MKIKVMSTPKCSNCTLVKNFLDEKRLKYENIDLTRPENRRERQHYRSLGLKDLPIIIIDKEDGSGDIIIEGLDLELLEESISND